MQILNQKFDISNHEVFDAITIKQPFADNLIKGARIILVPYPIKHKGSLIICSGQEPHKRYSSSVKKNRLNKTICYVDVIECVKVSDLSADEWIKYSGLKNMHEKEIYKHAYALKINFKYELLSIDILHGGVGIWQLIVRKGTLIEKSELKPIKKTNVNFLLFMFGFIILTLMMLMHLFST